MKPPAAGVQARALPAGFSSRIVRWQRTHGRRDLPWQCSDPYRVWLSEVMLQQTQVGTVLAYYARFLDRFPDVASLAAANEDDVLSLWSGLGYYSRARNLHRCAQEVMAAYGGEFPRTAEGLQALPGIGRSTAAAIAAFCFGERIAILDGNVKRVLARVLAFGEDIAQARNIEQLWAHAGALLPARDLARAMPSYTQGLMDLGATICLPRKPVCEKCPVASLCASRAQGRQQDYPVKVRRTKRSAQSIWLLHAQRDDGAVWLEKRPAAGIWAGLYCLPAFESRESLQQALPPGPAAVREHDAVLHVLTHRDLYLHPIELRGAKGALNAAGEWVLRDQWPALGLPAPIRRWLSRAESAQEA